MSNPKRTWWEVLLGCLVECGGGGKGGRMGLDLGRIENKCDQGTGYIIKKKKARHSSMLLEFQCWEQKQEGS